jgi:hypothetical protein
MKKLPIAAKTIAHGLSHPAVHPMSAEEAAPTQPITITTVLRRQWSDSRPINAVANIPER